MAKHLPHTSEILQNIDVLVDGRFEMDLLDLKLKFRGSRNQRVIDIPTTVEKGEVVWSNAVDDQDLFVFKASPEKEKFAHFLD